MKLMGTEEISGAFSDLVLHGISIKEPQKTVCIGLVDFQAFVKAGDSLIWLVLLSIDPGEENIYLPLITVDSAVFVKNLQCLIVESSSISSWVLSISSEKSSHSSIRLLIPVLFIKTA